MANEKGKFYPSLEAINPPLGWSQEEWELVLGHEGAEYVWQEEQAGVNISGKEE